MAMLMVSREREELGLRFHVERIAGCARTVG
jgi:hypothetical protein